MFNLLRWLVESAREIDRGMAVMRSEVEPGTGRERERERDRERDDLASERAENPRPEGESQ